MSNKNLPSFDDFVQGAFKVDNETFQGKGKEWLDKTYSDRSFEIYPGVFMHTKKYHEFQRQLYNNLRDIPPEWDSERGYYYYSNANQCLVDWGALSGSILPPMENNQSIRESKRLRDPDSQEIKLIEEVIDRLLAKSDFSSIHLKKISNCGFPYMQSGLKLKLAIVKKVFRNFSDFVRSTAERDFSFRYDRFGSYPVFTNGIRVQADTVKMDEKGNLFTKQRYSFKIDPTSPYDAAKLVQFPIDKTVRLDDTIVSDIFAARVRSMYALDYFDNCVLQCINNYLYQGLKNTIKGCDYKGELLLSKEIKNFLNYKEGCVFTLDKSEFGETFCPKVLSIFLDRISRKWSPDLAEFIRVTLDAVTCVRGLHKDKVETQWTRNTIEKEESYSLKGSFKSGHGLVAILGKLLGAIDAMLIIRRAFPEVFKLDTFLDNSSSFYRYYGSGDDTMFVTKTLSAKKSIEKAVTEGASLHFDELEDGSRFLGYYYSNCGDVHTNIAKMIERLTGVERSYKSKKHHAFGLSFVLRTYYTNPLFPRIYDEINGLLKKFYNFNLDVYSKGWKDFHLSEEELLFLYKPDVIWYMPELADRIDDTLLAQEYEVVSAESIADVFNRL